MRGDKIGLEKERSGESDCALRLVWIEGFFFLSFGWKGLEEAGQAAEQLDAAERRIYLRQHGVDEVGFHHEDHVVYVMLMQ